MATPFDAITRGLTQAGAIGKKVIETTNEDTQGEEKIVIPQNDELQDAVVIPQNEIDEFEERYNEEFNEKTRDHDSAWYEDRVKEYIELDNNEDYTGMAPSERYACRTLGKEMEKAMRLLQKCEERESGTGEIATTCETIDLIKSDSRVSDYYEKVGYLIAQREHTDPYSLLRTFVRGNTAIEYAEEQGINLTVNQAGVLYDAKDSEDVIRQIEEIRAKERGKNPIKIDTDPGFNRPDHSKSPRQYTPDGRPIIAGQANDISEERIKPNLGIDADSEDLYDSYDESDFV